MPVVLALLALLAWLAVPATLLAHDLEPTSAAPDVTIVLGSSVRPAEVRMGPTPGSPRRQCR